MGELNLILTLTGGLAAALACGYVTFRLGLSPIVGYLLAGLIVGPHTPGFIADEHLAGEMAELGVVLLMFGVGLQFHIEELWAVRRVAVPGAVVQSLVATGLGALVAAGCGWGWATGLVFGMALSVASTVVLLRVLVDNGDLHTPAGHVAVGWLVVEDLFTVLVLVLLPAAFAPGAGLGGVALALFGALAKVGVMVGLTFVLGLRIVPWVLARVAATRSRELFTLTVLVLALGIAVGSVRFFGVSIELGAFLAGMVVGRTEFSLRAATEALPMRDAFAVLFFVTVGIAFRPRYLIEAPGVVAMTLAVVLLGKSLAACAIVLALKSPPRVAATVAVALAQIGEFSFILASAGERLGLIDDRARNALTAAAILSITLNPLMYRLIGPLERALIRVFGEPAPAGIPTAAPARTDRRARDRAVIIGYGPVGRTLARLLRENRIEPVVLELNHETVRRLNVQGVAAFYGDAAHAATLERADLEHAVALFLSASGLEAGGETIRQARALNPRLLIAARSAYLHEVPALRDAGADVVFSGEGEVALAMTEFLLRQLGASAEQIDRERDRIRAELFRESPDPGTVPVDHTMRTANEADGPGIATGPARQEVPPG